MSKCTDANVYLPALLQLNWNARKNSAKKLDFNYFKPKASVADYIFKKFFFNKYITINIADFIFIFCSSRKLRSMHTFY